jgi:hypothetical protein
VGVVRKALDNFVVLSKLMINPEKSHVFMSSVDDDLKASILDFLWFRLGSLPIRYLGVLLITTQLKHGDCMALVSGFSLRLGYRPQHLLHMLVVYN